MSRVRSPENMRIAAVILRELHKRGMKRWQLAEAVGVTPTMVGFWTTGRYAPALDNAGRLAEVLDQPEILRLAKIAHVGTCLVCLTPFERNQTRRKFCSLRHQRDYHKGVRASAKHPAELAVADYCRGCEPEGVCRDDTCPLRAFSPFVFAARRVA